MVTSQVTSGERRQSARASRRWLGVALIAALPVTAGCGPLGRNVQDDAHNSRNTGSWLSLGRAQGSDGALVVHIAASKPENGARIADQIVRQNYATAAQPIRIIIDPMVGDAERQVYRWDGRALNVDHSTEGLPPRASRPDADGGEASPH